MGIETFHNSKLSEFDFEQGTPKSFTQKVSNLPLPDELPRPLDLSQLPREILKSSTVENLISQNEDLMARLKVSLRRLSILETENQKMSEETSKARLSQSSITDQILIWKEKDNRWKAKVDNLEREKEIQSEKLMALQEKLQILSADLLRHEKYHERIKNQVKPYITQLKEYSKTQEIKLLELDKNLIHKETQLRDIRNQIIEVTKNYRSQVETSEKKSQELVKYYEEQIEKMNFELQGLRQNQEDLELKALKLNTALERQDALENELIIIKRSKKELQDRFMNEINASQQRQAELTKQNQKIGVEHADLQIRVLDDQERIQNLERENKQQIEQLESLRFMWTQKNEESERLKMAAAALERLNVELSQKLNELRK